MEESQFLSLGFVQGLYLLDGQSVSSLQFDFRFFCNCAFNSSLAIDLFKGKWCGRKKVALKSDISRFKSLLPYLHCDPEHIT